MDGLSPADRAEQAACNPIHSTPASPPSTEADDSSPQSPGADVALPQHVIDLAREKASFLDALAPTNNVVRGLTIDLGRRHAGQTERPVPSSPAAHIPAGPSVSRRKKRVSLAEAEIRVREWLVKHAKHDPAAVTRDALATATGVSSGNVSKTSAWKAFCECRDAGKKPAGREVTLTDPMMAVIPADCAEPDELAELIEEQRADEAEQDRRHNRRQKPS